MQSKYNRNFSIIIKLKFLLNIVFLAVLAVQFKTYASPVLPNSANNQLTQPKLPQLPLPQDILPPTSPLPQQPLLPSPPPVPVIPAPAPNLPQQLTPETEIKFLVSEFKFDGSSVFKDKPEKLLQAIEVFLFASKPASQLLNQKDRCDALKESEKNPPPRIFPRSKNDAPVELTFAQLLEARSAITQLYICKGYITSGAMIPEQKFPPPPEAGVAVIQIVEGTLEDIQIIGTRRLNPNYIRSRLRKAKKQSLNRDQLLETLKLLQLNPRIENLSAELAAGTRFGTNLLVVKVKEARTFHTDINLDNNRSPSIGSFQRGIQLREENLLGIGDTIGLAYANTDGSNQVNFNYTLPLTSDDTTLSFSYGLSYSSVIQKPFDKLDISSNSYDYQLTLRHPVFQNPVQELAMGVNLSHQRTQTFIGIDDIGPFALSPGADDEGRTNISALRFFQEWFYKGDSTALAIRSQFSIGLGIFGSTNQEVAPDTYFFSWLGQAQWVQRLAPDTLLVIRGDLQLADRRLVSLEQFRLGGINSVRGYRQDAGIADNGFFGSVELRLPIARIPEIDGVLQVTPFFDIGIGWNNYESSDLKSNTLLSTGLGLRFRIGQTLNARLDWGIPLISVSGDKNTSQEQSLHFTLLWSPF